MTLNKEFKESSKSMFNKCFDATVSRCTWSVRADRSRSYYK